MLEAQISQLTRLRDTVLMGNHFDAVLFDFHGTLVSSRADAAWIEQAHARLGNPAAETHSVPPTGLVERLSAVWKFARRRDPECLWDLDGDAHRAAFNKVLTEDLGCSEALAGALYDTMPEQWRLFDESHEVLTRLSGAGLAMGIVSNIGIDIRPRLQTLGILPLIDSVVLSFEAGVKKPDPRVFARALDELGSSPARTLMVGDTWDQDGGAGALGIPTLILPDGNDRSRGLLSVLDICGTEV